MFLGLLRRRRDERRNVKSSNHNYNQQRGTTRKTKGHYNRHGSLQSYRPIILYYVFLLFSGLRKKYAYLVFSVQILSKRRILFRIRLVGC